MIERGRVVSVHVGEAGNRTKESRPSIEVRLDGINGDKHAGFTRKALEKEDYPTGIELRNDRQWSALSVSEVEIMRTKMNLRELAAGVLGPNLVIDGIDDFSRLPRGTKLTFPSGATLVVEGFNPPCADMGTHIASVYPKDADGKPTQGNMFPKAAINERGLVGVVDRPGIITVGEEVVVVRYVPRKFK